MKKVLSAFLAGMLFGFGLCLSQMVNPSVVVGFLDVTGSWDPRLLFVMGGALAVTLVTFPLIKRRCVHPVCDAQFHMPSNIKIDKKLVFGAMLFGVGWGLGGICPGPAIAVLAFGFPQAFLFLASMLTGMFVFRVLVR